MGELVEDLAALSAGDFSHVVEEVLRRRSPGSSFLAEDVVALLGLDAASHDVLLSLAPDSPVVITADELSGASGRGSVVDGVLQQIRIEAAVRQRLLREVPFLDSSAVAALLGREGRNTRDAASALRRRGHLLGVEVRGRSLFPQFQVDPLRARVVPVVVGVNQLLGAVKDPWGVLDWWMTPSSRWVDGAAPAALVGTADEGLVRAYAEALRND